MQSKCHPNGTSTFNMVCSAVLLNLLVIIAVVCPSSALMIRYNNDRGYRVSMDDTDEPACPCSKPTQEFATRPIVLDRVKLPYRIPRQRTLSHKCRCVKTILRHRPVYQTIIVPVVRKYVQTLVRPVTETIAQPFDPRLDFEEN